MVIVIDQSCVEQFASRLLKKSFTLGSYNLTKTYCEQLSDKIKTQSQVFLV